MAFARIKDTNAPGGRLDWAPFALGFRPFFLGAGLAGLILVALWLLQWAGVLPVNGYYGAINWHAHELLFGYTSAVIAGFLLTAVRNWTGVNTPTGGPLAGLALLWLAGRLVPFVPSIPGYVIAIVDLAFLPALALSLLKPLLAGQNRTNLIMLVFLAAMFVANAITHADALQLLEGVARTGQLLMLDVIVLLILMISGRVLPFFTEAALPCSPCRRHPAVEAATFITLVAMTAADVAGRAQFAGILAFIAALIQIVRIAGWYKPGLVRVPILLILYLGYVWLIVGLFMKGLAGFGQVGTALAIHAFTVGGIGVITLGMMARVALGHTGRMMRAAPLTNIGFVLINLAAVVRILLPIVAPAYYNAWIHLSGLLWILAFAAFLWVYAPILMRSRVDGQPG